MVVLLALFFILACVKWGDWRNWRKYYPTILFLSLGDYIHEYLVAAKPLFRFTYNIFPGVVSHQILALVIYPASVLLFLPHFPESGLVRKALYICLWTGLFSILEYWGVNQGYYAYFNGWNFQYSILVNLVLFPILAIHHRNPLLAWLIYSCVALFTVYWFQIAPSH